MNKLRQIQAMREAGMVERCHTLPHHGSYSIGQHSYGVISLLLILHPNPSIKLVKAAMWHDAAERWMGDLPSPGKISNPSLKVAYEETEEELLVKLGVPVLTEESDRIWLKALDLLDLWLWAREQLKLGNQCVIELEKTAKNILQSLMATNPDILAPLIGSGLISYFTVNEARLSDFQRNL